MLAPLLLLAIPQVDVTLTTVDPSVTVGCTVEVDLVLTAPTSTAVSAVDAVLEWNPAQLELIDTTAGPGWFVAAFLNDPDGINDDVTDGDAIYTALSSPSSPVSVRAAVDVATFRFKVLDDGLLDLAPSMGAFAHTAVYGAVPGMPVTGTIQAPLPITGVDVIAVEAVRLGFPPNPNALTPGVTNGPVLNQVWDPRIDHTTFLPAAVLDTIVLVPTLGPPVNIPSPYGTILVDLASPTLIQEFNPPGVPFQFPVPCVCSLVGLEITAQGASIAPLEIAATNALDLIVGTL